MPDVQFNTCYRYDDLTRLIQAFAQEHPQLVRVESLGKSYEGRDIWLATITRFETGQDKLKPALWVDGNIHASEVSPSTLCLYLINKLVTEYGRDPDITRCLDTRVFYVCPRVNPDGAEWALADKPKIVRSSTRPYPYDEEPLGGLVEEDVDGDGRMLWMRVPDPNGAWKTCPEEPRLLVRREPTEVGGQYYRLLPEGTIKEYDGVTIKMQSKKERLDLNRNFPIWRQEYEQPGAGPYPTSEPETHALTHFIANHPNVTGCIAFHTYSGALLRPYCDKSDDSFPAEDLWTYKKIGQKGADTTSYPAVSVHHDFRYHPNQILSGGIMDWQYDHLGLFAWGVELWSPQRQAGIGEYKFIEWAREHPLEDDLKLLKWSDKVLQGKGYINWYPFAHPQLGQVELGGWDQLYAWRNPPADFLEQEIAPFAAWLVWHLLISPRLEVYEASVRPVGEGAYRVRLVVHNTGWLPSYVTKKALEKKVARGVVCEIELPEGAMLEMGKLREELGQLEGRAYKEAQPGANDETADRIKVEWIVRAPPGSIVKLTARHERAGTVFAQVVLD